MKRLSAVAALALLSIAALAWAAAATRSPAGGFADASDYVRLHRAFGMHASPRDGEGAGACSASRDEGPVGD